MSGSIVVLTYGIAALLALSLLYFVGSKRWYWHLGSVLVALLVGLMPPPEGWAGQRFDLTVGCLFLFLSLWGIGGIFFRHPHKLVNHH
jgi:hypothetical protein